MLLDVLMLRKLGTGGDSNAPMSTVELTIRAEPR